MAPWQEELLRLLKKKGDEPGMNSSVDGEINVPEGDVLAQGYLDELIRLAATYSTATSGVTATAGLRAPSILS